MKKQAVEISQLSVGDKFLPAVFAPGGRNPNPKMEQVITEVKGSGIWCVSKLVETNEEVQWDGEELVVKL